MTTTEARVATPVGTEGQPPTLANQARSHVDDGLGRSATRPTQQRRDSTACRLMNVSIA